MSGSLVRALSFVIAAEACFPVIPEEMVQCPALVAYTGPIPPGFSKFDPASISPSGASCPAGESLYGEQPAGVFNLVYSTICDTSSGLWTFNSGGGPTSTMISFACALPGCTMPDMCTIGANAMSSVVAGQLTLSCTAPQDLVLVETAGTVAVPGGVATCVSAPPPAVWSPAVNLPFEACCIIQCPALVAYTGPIPPGFSKFDPASISPIGASCPAGEFLYGEQPAGVFDLVSSTICDLSTGLWTFNTGAGPTSTMVSFACALPACTLPDPCTIGVSAISSVVAGQHTLTCPGPLSLVLVETVCCATGGEWSEWADVTPCPTTCGSCNVAQRTRTCTSAAAGCPCTGQNSEIGYCGVALCPFVAIPPVDTCCLPTDKSLNMITNIFFCGLSGVPAYDYTTCAITTKRTVAVPGGVATCVTAPPPAVWNPVVQLPFEACCM